MIEKYKKDILALLILSFAVFLASKALFHSGFFRTIDDITTVRIMYMVKELQRGEWVSNFPVRFSADLSHRYGYPVYLFYGSLTYYIGALLMMFGNVSHIVSTKIVYVLPLLYGPYLFYIAVRQKVGILAALTASIFYALYPFRGFDTYYRGGAGEAWAMAFIPGIFLGIFLLEKNKLLGGLLFSLFFALAILSHNLSGFLIIALVVLYGTLFKLKELHFWSFFLLGLGLVCFFWLPSFYYLPIVKVSYSTQNSGEILTFLRPFIDLINPQASLFADRKYQAYLFYLLIAAFIFILWKYKKEVIKRKELFFWSGIGVFFYFLLSNTSIFIWKLTLPITRILQFPWRIFILLSFIQPFIAALWISEIRSKLKYVLAGVIMILSVFYSQYFQPKEYSYFYEYSAVGTGVCGTTWGEEYLPLWVKDCHGFSRPEQDIIGNDKIKINEIYNNGLRIEAVLDATSPTTIDIEKYYYPWWSVYIDGKKTPIDYTFSRWGTMRVAVPEGKHTVLVKTSKTTVMWISDVISLFSISIFLYILFLLIKDKKIIKKS